jgi:hypothetical protein
MRFPDESEVSPTWVVALIMNWVEFATGVAEMKSFPHTVSPVLL